MVTNDRNKVSNNDPTAKNNNVNNSSGRYIIGPRQTGEMIQIRNLNEAMI